MKKLFGLLAVGMLLAAPAFAQSVTVTVDNATPKSGDKVKVCAAADASVKGVASWTLTFTFPAGFTESGDFDHNTNTITGSALYVGNANVAGQFIVGLVGTTDQNGPGSLGCFNLVAGDTAASGDVAVSIDASNANGDSVAVSGSKATLTVGTVVTPPATGGLTVTVDNATPKSGDTVKVCSAIDSSVKGVASWTLTFTFPTGFTESGDFDHNTNTITGSALYVGNANVAGQFIVGLVGTTDQNGPGSLGCFNLVAGDKAVSGDINVSVDASNANGDSVKVATVGTAVTVSTVVTPPTGCPTVTATTGQINVDSVSGTVGKTINVAVDAASDFKGFAAAVLTITFDPKVLSFTGAAADIKAGTVLGSPLTSPNTNNAATGTIVIGLVSSANSTAGGNIVTFPLTILANATTPTKTLITVTGDLSDQDGKSVTATYGNGVVTVGDCGGTVVTPVAGDVNGDGKVDVSDVHSAIQVLFGINTTAADVKAADYNGDGKVDLIDIRLLLQLVVKG